MTCPGDSAACGTGGVGAGIPAACRIEQDTRLPTKSVQRTQLLLIVLVTRHTDGAAFGDSGPTAQSGGGTSSDKQEHRVPSPESRLNGRHGLVNRRSRKRARTRGGLRALGDIVWGTEYDRPCDSRGG
jgi:hypothetical protein